MASYYDDGEYSGSDNYMDDQCVGSEDDFASQESTGDDEQAPTAYMYLTTLVEYTLPGSGYTEGAPGGRTSRLVGVYTTKENAIKAARNVMKRRSGRYRSTGRCEKPNIKDHTATVGDQGTLFDEHNEYGETKTISLAKVPVNQECNHIITEQIEYHE
jgi:hypothetical protein